MAPWQKKAAGGAAAVLGAAAVAWYLRERATEKPAYTTEQEDAAFSLRRYPALLIAETRDEGRRDDALDAGFDRLAGYIFAKDRPTGDSRKVAMTAPVLSNETATGWRTRFVMPRGFTETSLPRPGAGVRIDTLPPRRVAALRFAGRATDRRLAKAEARLRAWADSRALTAVGPVEHAYYNSPMIPGPLRHNEVLLPVTD